MSQVNRSSIVALTAFGVMAGTVSGCDVRAPIGPDNSPIRPTGARGCPILRVVSDDLSFPPCTARGEGIGAGSGSATGLGPVRELASGLDWPARVALDDDFVYWVNLGYGTSLPGSVMRVAKSGGEPQLLAIEPEFPASLVVDDEAVYWTASGGKRGGTGAVMRVTKTGGKPVALVTGLYWPDELEQDDDFLYWTEAFVGVERVAKRGGTRSILVPGMTLSSGLAVDRDRVYFADYDTGWILSVAKTGGPVTRIAAVHSLDIPFFAVDGEFVYWHVGRGEVLKVPTSGGAPCVLFSSDHKLMDFVVTPDDLYIADMGDPVDLSDPLGMRPGSGAIRRITRTGGGNTPVTPPAVGNEAVAVDAQNVYWTNQSWTGLSTGTLNAIGR